MLNWSTIGAAVKTLLVAQLPASDDGRAYLVERAEVLNRDPGKTPWVGVYAGGATYRAHTLGKGTGVQNWRVALDLWVIVQAASHGGGAAAEALREEYVQDVLTALETDRTWGGTVLNVTGYRVEYSYVISESDTIIMQQAKIIASAEANA